MRCQTSVNPKIVNFQPFILDEMRTYWIPHYQKQSVPYAADEIRLGLVGHYRIQIFTHSLDVGSSLPIPICFYITGRIVRRTREQIRGKIHTF